MGIVQVVFQFFDASDSEGRTYRAYSARLQNGARSLREVTKQYEVMPCIAEDGRPGFIVLKRPETEYPDL